MKKNIKISLGVLLVAIISMIVLSNITNQEDTGELFAEVQKGMFEINVMVTGELQAENFVLISGPSELRTSRGHRFSQVKIVSLVDEGTVVKEGDIIAELDRSEINNRLKDLEDEVESARDNLEQTRLDTNINMRSLRDQLVNLKFSKEETAITLEQSKYESPAVKRQAQINLEKAERSYDQAVLNYDLKEQKYSSQMKRAQLKLGRQRRDYSELEDLIKRFTITAPSPGMVIYYKGGMGEKRKVGSTINGWDLTVATLPDLSSMITKTYVNEIDISRVKKGQDVEIGVDAFPEKSFTGEVTSVANIGEQLPNTDAKVFEVFIKLNESDPVLRPAMTTSNKILTRLIEDVKYIPLEAIYLEDSIPVVYMKNGVKQVVLLGESNENQVIVEQGLDAGDKIILSAPEKPEKYRLRGEEIIELIKERSRLQRLEEERMKEEAAKRETRQGRSGRMGGRRPGMSPGGRGSRPHAGSSSDSVSVVKVNR